MAAAAASIWNAPPFWGDLKKSSQFELRSCKTSTCVVLIGSESPGRLKTGNGSHRELQQRKGSHTRRQHLDSKHVSTRAEQHG